MARRAIRGGTGAIAAPPFDPALGSTRRSARPSTPRACLAALVDGTADAVATDHAPHTEVDKAVEFGLREATGSAASRRRSGSCSRRWMPACCRSPRRSRRSPPGLGERAPGGSGSTRVSSKASPPTSSCSIAAHAGRWRPAASVEGQRTRCSAGPARRRAPDGRGRPDRLRGAVRPGGSRAAIRAAATMPDGRHAAEPRLRAPGVLARDDAPAPRPERAPAPRHGGRRDRRRRATRASRRPASSRSRARRPSCSRRTRSAGARRRATAASPTRGSSGARDRSRSAGARSSPGRSTASPMEAPELVFGLDPGQRHRRRASAQRLARACLGAEPRRGLRGEAEALTEFGRRARDRARRAPRRDRDRAYHGGLAIDPGGVLHPAKWFAASWGSPNGPAPIFTRACGATAIRRQRMGGSSSRRSGGRSSPGTSSSRRTATRTAPPRASAAGSCRSAATSSRRSRSPRISPTSCRRPGARTSTPRTSCPTGTCRRTGGSSSAVGSASCRPRWTGRRRLLFRRMLEIHPQVAGLPGRVLVGRQGRADVRPDAAHRAARGRHARGGLLRDGRPDVHLPRDAGRRMARRRRAARAREAPLPDRAGAVRGPAVVPAGAGEFFRLQDRLAARQKVSDPTDA